MKKWKITLYAFLILICGFFIVSLTPKETVSADEGDILVVFDYNSSTLSPHLMDSYRKLGIVTDYVTIGDIASPSLTTSQASVLNKLQDYYVLTWTLNGTQVDVSTYAISKTTTFVAKWTPIQYNVYYYENPELGYNRVDTYTIESGRFTYYVPTKDHYKFKEWCTTKTYNPYTVERYRPSGSIGDVQLYAHWQPREYGITYHTDAENKFNPISYNIESADIKLLAVEKTGYNFMGWFLDEDCTQSISTIKTGSYGNINLYPLFEAKTYKVTYTMPNGTKYIIDCKYGDTAELPEVKTNIFQVVVTDKSRKNIQGDTQIEIKLHNIWYVYVLGLLAFAGCVTGIVFAFKKRHETHSHLRYMYHSNQRNRRL